MKTKRSQNALTHGLYARDTLLPWEDPEAFDALHQAIREELGPSGPLEESAVRAIAELEWRKHRLAVGFLLPFFKNPPPPELVEAGRDGIAALAAYLADPANRAQQGLVATTTEVLDYIKARRTRGSALPAASAKSAGQVSVAGSAVEPAYDIDTIEHYLKVEGMIDTRIAKAMSRLVGFKEFKKLYGQQPVQSLPPTAAPPLVAPPEASVYTNMPSAPPEASITPASATDQPAKSGWTITNRRK